MSNLKENVLGFIFVALIFFGGGLAEMLADLILM